MSKIFIVVREDRHFDPEISVHRTRAGADRAVEEFQTRYGDRYQWHDEPIGRDLGWLRYVATNMPDDGPNVRIESGELEP